MQHNRKNAKLTPAQVYQIRLDYAQTGKTQIQLAVEHGVSLNTIRNVLTGATWQDVPMVKTSEEESYDLQQSQQKLLKLVEAPPVLDRRAKDLDDVELATSIAQRMSREEAEDPLEAIMRRRSSGNAEATEAGTGSAQPEAGEAGQAGSDRKGD